MRIVMIFNSILVTLLIAGAGLNRPEVPRVQPEAVEARGIRPTAIELDETEQKLVVSSSNGEALVLDVKTQKVLSKTKIGGDLADLVALDDGNSSFLTVDRENHQLIKFVLDSSDIPQIVWSKDVCQYPSRIAVNEQGTVAVAGHWSRQISFLAEPSESAIQTLNIDFVPGQLAWLSNRSNHLLVADSFGSKAVVAQFATDDGSSTGVEPPSIVVRRTIPDRRVGGMTIANGQIVMATQMLNPLARSTRNDVHWGLMVSNDVESMSEQDFLSDEFNFSKDRRQQPIGGAGDAKADAECVVVTASNQMVVALGGAKQIAIGSTDEFGFAYLYVGRRPVDLVVNQSESNCYVANQLDGSVSFVDLKKLEVSATVLLEAKHEYTLVEQGERLFFDASLAHDGWMSCHSCHVNGHTSGLINDNLSDGTFGTPKRVLSLLGHGSTEPLAWNGGHESLNLQVRKSIEVTMQADDRPSEQTVEAISAYVRQLAPPPSLSKARGLLNADKIEKGREIFTQLNCNSCHIPPHFTSEGNYEVGLEDEKGESSFNPPSLIGLGQRDSLMHDGRAKSLEEVFTKIEHQIPNKLSDQKLSNLLAFLKSL